MKIKNTYRIAFVAALFILMTSGYSLFLGKQYLLESTRTHHLTGEIIHDLSQLKAMTYHYLLYHEEEDAEWQWKMKYKSVVSLIEDKAFSSNYESIIIEIEDELKRLESLFGELIITHNREQNLSGNKRVIIHKYEQRLVGQLIVNMQMLVEKSLHLARMNEEKQLIVQNRVILLLIIFFLLMFITLLAVSIWLRYIIVNPIKKLHRGTEVVGTGDLTYKIGLSQNNEIGQLARGFDQMIEKLHKITVSHEQLSKEIEVRQRVETELVRAKKYEALAILSGGIAHDFNNLLAIIIGNIDMARDEVPPGDQLDKLLNEAQTASLQAESLIDKFLTLSVSVPIVKAITSLRQLLIDSATMQVKDSDVRCDFSLHENLWRAEIDRDQITIAFNNIIINAKDSMPEGGIIKIIGENVLVRKEKTIQTHSLVSGEYVRIAVLDQGQGIAPENLDKVLDPYFSTRDRGKEKGMGLGLTISNTIIRKHEGLINIESPQGEGTTVSIYLPAIASAGV